MLDTPNYTPSALARHFWSLLVGVTVMAILSSGLALWYTANPFLRDQQNNAIQTSAEDSARNVEVVLQQHRQMLAFIASQKNIISVSLGYVENADILKQFITGAEIPENLVWLGLFDAFGETLAVENIGDVDMMDFDDADVASVVAPIVDPNGEARAGVLLRRRGSSYYLLIATPVRNNGFTEGVLVGRVNLVMEDVFPPSPIIQSATIIDSNVVGLLLDNKDETRAPVADTNLVVSIVPDREHNALAGRQLLLKTVGAISLVMFSACGALAVLGRKHIIAPHLRLQVQKRELSELAAVARLASDSIVITDLDEKIVWTNPAFEQLSGYRFPEVKGLRARTFLPAKKKNISTLDAKISTIESASPIKEEVENLHKSGNSYWVSLTTTALIDDHGDAYGFMSFASDVTDAKRQREELIRSKNETEIQAMQDSLTGLPNRRAFDGALDERRADGAVVGTVIRIDLDHFKYVNDTMGHAAGDFVLCQIAKILNRCIRHNPKGRPTDLAARLGGDEFVILLGFGASVETAKELSARLLSEIRKPMQYEGKSINISASLGIASSDESITTSEEILAGADAALYEAKESGRDKVSIYTPELHRNVQKQREMAIALRTAIKNREFEPYFQPQFDAKTDEICGVEVLARWPSKSLGLLTPPDFFPIAEQLSLMQDVDRILFEKAMEQIVGLRQSGIHIPKISFNATAERLTSGELYDAIVALGPDRPAIAIEVLESVLVEEESDRFHFEIDRLKEAGVSIEIDDFGSGHTSFVGIMKLKPDVMKIDKRLIIPVLESEQVREMLLQIIDMARIMGLKITAEGVETEAHVDLLKPIGCDVLQGFGLANPMPIGDLASFVSEKNQAAGSPPFVA